MSLTVTEAGEQLKPLLMQRKLLVFAGSGVSVPSHLPTWDELLDKFIVFCENLQPYLTKEERFDDLLADAKLRKQGYPAQVASVLKRRLAEIQETGVSNVLVAFKKWLNDLLSGEPNDYHRLIVSTDYPFILTTNYDNLLEKAAEEQGYLRLVINSFTFDHTAKVAAAVYDRQPSIIHVHGDLNDLALDKFIFTAEDYQIIEKDYPGFRLALQSLFLHYSVLFVGYGASDPHLEKLMEELAHYLRWSTQRALPRCYLILRRDKTGAVHDRYKEGLRTKIISITSYDETLALLQQLCNAAPRGKEA